MHVDVLSQGEPLLGQSRCQYSCDHLPCACQALQQTQHIAMLHGRYDPQAARQTLTAVFYTRH